MFETLEVNADGPIGELWLNRPERLNALSTRVLQELADAAALGDTTGMFNCPHTGVALAALIKLIKAGQIDRAEHVVVISTAHGLKFTDFKVAYHEEKLEFPCHYANKPVELPPSVDAVKEALQQALIKRRSANV